MYCIFAQLTNSNVLGKLPIRDSNNRVNWKLLLVDSAKIQYTRDGERTDLRLHSSYAFFIRAYTHVKVEFALHPTYEITKFIKGQHSVLCMI